MSYSIAVCLAQGIRVRGNMCVCVCVCAPFFQHQRRSRGQFGLQQRSSGQVRVQISERADGQDLTKI